ncbi:type IV pili methyl-accepting chemotaxis transducer N-terminal domain-containing protein [Thiocapsa sp.]|uniref:type IV pili methyl-accepting chemotaxis transducer N-terminal domain-containing protein n=1 Tax=Thiocapsa sp. TaxID=2024551 RepID=UPI0035930411
MSSLLPRFLHRSILLGVGVLMTAVILLAVVSMSLGGFVAQTTEGLAAAVNQSGSLRMQSYRIGMTLADGAVPTEQRAGRVAVLAEEFEQRLASPRLADAIPTHAGDAVRTGYERIRADWRERMQPRLRADIARLRDADRDVSEAQAPLSYLENVDGFVGLIDALVHELETLAEGRLAMLRVVQTIALILTIGVVLITMVLVRGRVIQPLGELLECADRSRRGDFSGRTRFTGIDELGRLGEAINRMASDLSHLYEDLEGRVAAKTRDLERTNHSLELLYGVGQTLHRLPISAPVFTRALHEIRDRLRLRDVTLCLRDRPDSQEGRYRVSTRSGDAQHGACSADGCGACRDARPFGPEPLSLRSDGRQSPVSFPVTDQDRCFGVLLVDLEEGQALPPWQGRLLGSLAALIGTALSLQQRQRDARRLSLFEERGVIARELHDSLAQSLSYLKIQAARLDALLGTAAEPERIRGVLAELREGISNAYRQLRELLTTFRLKMDDRGLNAALEATVAEYRARGTTEVCLDNQLPAALLGPNEEIHVLQIVREALSNVVRHAGAAHACLTLAASDAGIDVTLEDDGCGIDPQAVPRGHYGLKIMGERAASLGGVIEIGPGRNGGTRVRLTFPNRDARIADDRPVAAVHTS